MAEFLKGLFERLEQAPIATVSSLIIFLIAAPLIVRIWRSTGPGLPMHQGPGPGADQPSPWIGMQILHQTDEIVQLRGRVDALIGKVDALTAAVDGVVALVRERRRHRPRK